MQTELKVERSGHIQGIGSKCLKIAERGEHFSNLAFCSDSVLSENVLMIFWHFWVLWNGVQFLQNMG